MKRRSIKDSKDTYLQLATLWHSYKKARNNELVEVFKDDARVIGFIQGLRFAISEAEQPFYVHDFVKHMSSSDGSE